LAYIPVFARGPEIIYERPSLTDFERRWNIDFKGAV